jgi:tetratricopeptide (TPR) repeat protein
LVVLFAGAAEPPPLSPLDRARWDAAVEAEAAGDSERALSAWRSLLRFDPGFSEARRGVARQLDGRGDAAGAEAVLRDAPYDADCVEDLALLLARGGRVGEATALLPRLSALRAGDPAVRLLEAELVVAADPAAASDALRAAVRAYQKAGSAPDEAALVELTARVAAALAVSDPVGAGRLLDDIDDVGLSAEALDEARLLVAARTLAARLAQAAPTPLDPPTRAKVLRARELPPDQRVAALRALAEQVPRAPEVWAALASAQQEVGAVEEADRSWSWARALAPLDPDLAAAHGRLLATRFGPSAAPFAAAALEDAVRLDPGRVGLLLEIAELSLRRGPTGAADQALARVPPGAAERVAADQRRADLARTRQPGPTPPPLDARPPEVPPGAWSAWNLAEAWMGLGHLDRARDENARATTLAPGWAAGWSQAARIVERRGDLDAAASAWRVAAERGGADPEPWRRLGDVEARRGEGAAADLAYEVSAAHGGAAAMLTLAERARWPWSAWSWRAAFLDAGGAADPRSEAVLRRVLRWSVAAGGSVLVGVGLVVARLARRRVSAWRSSTLADLLRVAPGAAGEVAGRLAAIRHEVIKHRLSALTAVAAALDGGDPEPAAWLAARLAGPDGVFARYDAYIAALVALGRQHGVALDLVDVDPVVGPVSRALALLRGQVGSLQRGQPAASGALRAAAALIEPASERMSALIQEASSVVLDGARWRAMWEAAGPHGDGPSFEAAGPALRVRVHGADLEDVLVNLLRNASRASAASGGAVVRAEVSVDEDPVTGVVLARVVVADQAPAPLPQAALRAPVAGRGLSVVVAAVRRAGGAIRVVSVPGFSKGVAVFLPMVEEAT